MKKTISVSPSKAAPSFSGGHLKSLSLKCQPQQEGNSGVRNTAKTDFPGRTGYESSYENTVKCRKKIELYIILMLALDEQYAIFAQNNKQEYND